MKSLVVLVLLLVATLAQAQTPDDSAGAAQWIRYPAISPDGKTIAFAFRGHLFTVPAAGGKAEPLTAGPARDFQPIWSPDGKSIAYASDAYGNFDVFRIPAAGGAAARLTTHSADEIPTGFAPDGKSVLFSAHRMDARANAQFPSSRVMPELYRVSVEPGHAPEQILTTPALAAQYNRAGDHIVYEDLKGYENLWRKHHTSSVTHDLWMYDVANGTHTKLTDFAGEDRNPVWAPDEKAVFYLSEQSGSFNVWKLPLAPDAKPTQVTHFDKNPVRFLTVAGNGDLCFGYDGGIYVLTPADAAPHRVAVQTAVGDSRRRSEVTNFTDGATEIALNPDGKEVAFVVHGEVFVASTEFGDTKRITNTPTQERSVSFSPDGRRLLFAGETNKSWNLYEATLTQKKEDEPYFYNSTVVNVKPILENGEENFQPRYSPDGKEVAYLENRTTLKVLNLESKQSRLILAGDKNYSYSDGDQWFDWAPDGKWFAVQFNDPHRWSPEVGLVDAEGKQQLTNLTKSGYDDVRPFWSADGKALLWYSDRQALHGTGSTDEYFGDVYAMFMNQKAYDRFNLSKAEFDLVKKTEDDAAKAKDKDKKPDEKTAEDKKKDEKKEPIEIDLKNIEDRQERLTLGSVEVKDAAVTPDGELLVYLIKGDDGYELWQNKLREKETKRIAQFPEGVNPNARGEDQGSQVVIDKEGKSAIVLAGGRISKVDLKEGKSEPVKFAAEMNLDRAAERAYMYEHAWRQAKEKFYVTDMHKVDWDYYKGVYAKFLPTVENNYDFAELLSELLGELNASHTGSGYIPHLPGADETAALGVFYDPAYHGPGLKVDEILEKGPLVIAKSKIQPGMIIEKIDGVVIAPGADECPLLNRKAGKPTLLSVFDPAKNARFDETVKPIKLKEQEELLYYRFVKSRRELTDKLSGGRLGYVHVRGMNDKSYRDTYSEILGRQSGKEGLIVDTRFNGGGNLHDELATLLSGKAYLEFLPRGQDLGMEPVNKWNQRSALLIGESNYSDAHLFPWVYHHLAIGKMVGMPVPGTGTAVWWETQQDPTLYFGIPEVGFVDKKGEFMEHSAVVPDVRVENDSKSVAAGEDKQLERAVELLLQK